MPRIKPYASHIFVTTRSRPQEWLPYPSSPSPEFDAHLLRFKTEKRVLWNYAYRPDSVNPINHVTTIDDTDNNDLNVSSSTFNKDVNEGIDSVRDGSTDECLVFPEGVKSTIKDVMNGTVGGEKVVGAQVFICGHGTRDSRCGIASKQLVPTIQSFMAGIGNVYVTNHLGGHKFAGLLVIYLPPIVPTTSTLDKETNNSIDEKDISPAINSKIDESKGWSCVWYGKVTPSNVHHILESTINKRIVVPEFARYISGDFTQ